MAPSAAVSDRSSPNSAGVQVPVGSPEPQQLETVARINPAYVRGAVASLLLLAHAGLLARSAYVHSPALDEVGHLPAGLAVWSFCRFDLYRVNPPLVRAIAAVPVLLAGAETDWSSHVDGPGVRPEWSIGADLIKANGERAFWLFALARWACIPFSLVGAYVCYLWARSLFGTGAGFLALALWCFSPNVLGNGSMITPDTAAASMGVLAAYMFRRWLLHRTWTAALGAGLCLGLAELTKMTWIVLFAAWPLIALACRFTECRLRSRERARDVAQLGVVLLVGLYLLNLGYAFHGSLQRLDSFEFVSRALAGFDTQIQHTRVTGNRFQDTYMGRLLVPLPKDYVTGLDLQMLDFEVGNWSYLAGEFKHGGWWYYYLYALALKVPLGTWLLAALACPIAASRTSHLRWADLGPLIVPPLVVLVAASLQTGFSRYIRYVLPAFPFAFIWVSQVARFWRVPQPASDWANARVGALIAVRQRVGASLAAVGLFWAVGSSLWYYPHSLSYFNELAGGPKFGHRYLADANIDWGQDLLHLREWITAHPKARPLTVAYWGGFDERVAGVDFPRTPESTDLNTSNRLRPGWHAVSVGFLRHPSGKYDYLLEFEPAAYAGFSIHIYHLSAVDIEGVRRSFASQQQLLQRQVTKIGTNGRLAPLAGVTMSRKALDVIADSAHRVHASPTRCSSAADLGLGVG